MFKINGIIWQIYLVDPYHPMLLKSNGTFSVGSCDSETQGIYINDMLDGWFLKRVLCHEIVHAAIFSYNVILDIETEEFIAELIAKYGEEIIDITNSIFSKLSS